MNIFWIVTNSIHSKSIHKQICIATIHKAGGKVMDAIDQAQYFIFAKSKIF